MSVANPTPAACSGTDKVLAELVDELTACLKSGDAAGAEAILERRPEHADELRRLLPALKMLAELAPPEPEPDAKEAPVAGGSLGEFRIVREIGRGGMGIVYEAEQMSLGRRVALKVLPFAATLDAKQLQRFKNEAQAAAHLHHQNIVPVHSVGCDRGVHYYAMQFIEGHSLAELIADLRLQNAELRKQDEDKNQQARPFPSPLYSGERGRGEGSEPPRTPGPHPQPLSPEYRGEGRNPNLQSTICNLQSPTLQTTKASNDFHIVAGLGAQAAEALEHAHQVGVVHRDIKPANLLLDVRGNLWVADFGLAQFQKGTSLTLTGDMVGTLRYMSPEQALAKPGLIDHRTDIYSLGATLYELLTLVPVFAGADRQELLRQIAFEEPKPARRHNKSIPAELETIVFKALEKNPVDRYATAKDLAEDLDRFLKDEPIKARRPSLTRRFRVWCRRHKAVVSAAAMLALSLLVLGAVALWWQERLSAATVAAVTKDMEEAAFFEKQEQWPSSLKALDRASARLENSGLTSLQKEVAQHRRDAAMVVRLEQAQLQISSSAEARQRASGVSSEGKRDYSEADKAYQAAFAAHGLNVIALPREESARLIRESAIRTRLVTALDYWAFVRDRMRPMSDGSPLRAVAGLADDDKWRQKLRAAALAMDAKDLERLANEQGILAQPPANLLILSSLLDDAKARDAAVRLLRKAQQRYPADFWISFELAMLLAQDAPTMAKSLGFFRVAAAIQPHNPVVYNSFGVALKNQNKLYEAAEAYQRAIQLQPDYAVAYLNLGIALHDEMNSDVAAAQALYKAIQLKPDYAAAYLNLADHLGGMFNSGPEGTKAARKFMDTYQIHYDPILKAIKIQPDNADAYNHWGNALIGQHKIAEAEAAFRKAIGLNPDFELAHKNLRKLLIQNGQLEKARLSWEKQLERDPPNHDAWHGYAELCLFLGKEPEYRLACRALVKRFGATTDPIVAARTVRACLLLGDSGTDVGQTLAFIDRAAGNLKPTKADAAGGWRSGFFRSIKIPGAESSPQSRLFETTWPSVGYPMDKEIRNKLGMHAVDFNAKDIAFLFAKGLAEYRQGRLDRAIWLLDGDASDLSSWRGPRLVLAMAQHRKGQRAEASKTFAKAVVRYDVAGMDSLTLWISHVLRREAEAMFVPNIKAFLEGKYQPHDNDERIALLAVCKLRKHWRNVAHLWAQAHAADPTLVNNLVDRYEAASAAALAGCAKSNDAA